MDMTLEKETDRGDMPKEPTDRGGKNADSFNLNNEIATEVPSSRLFVKSSIKVLTLQLAILKKNSIRMDMSKYFLWIQVQKIF